jgi:hypothetical protein
MSLSIQIPLFQLCHVIVVDVCFCLLFIVTIHSHKYFDVRDGHVHGCAHHVHLPASSVHLHSRLPLQLVVHVGRWSRGRLGTA